ncbi:uncharacterized protein WM277_018317 isoform 1-T2 [Molossus nigricans]
MRLENVSLERRLFQKKELKLRMPPTGGGAPSQSGVRRALELSRGLGPAARCPPTQVGAAALWSAWGDRRSRNRGTAGGRPGRGVEGREAQPQFIPAASTYLIPGNGSPVVSVTQ